ncbi:MAG: peroxidase [Planctomycetes bacterium]|nr:peroxidase [Planctomycetota bacterium]
MIGWVTLSMMIGWNGRGIAEEFRSFDGTGNNQTNATWGGTGSQLLRLSPVGYADGVSTPGGATRPSARVISNAVAGYDDGVESMPNARRMTDFIYAWGQFVDHDIDLTEPGGTEAFNISVPTGDPYFDPASTGTQVINMTRSVFDPATGTGPGNPRQQINEITSYLDGSVVYGSDATRAMALREGSGGRLATSAGNLLPFNTAGFYNANDAHIVGDDQLFLAGDIRANENIELTSIQTLFMREHNRIADQIAAAHSELSDEDIYQWTRKVVGAEIQAITYNEFLPALLGDNALGAYSGYHADVNASIATEFSTAGYRLGHSLLADDVEFLDNDGNAVREEVPLAQAFFNPTLVSESGIDPILKYLASDMAQEVDSKVVGSVRNFLFGPPGAGGFDLASLNIQRGRDHGLSDYNTTRQAYGLAPIASFSEITSDTALAQTLADLYDGDVNDIDLWVGALAEDHMNDASVGETLMAILVDQFERLRDGDRFFYLNDADLDSPIVAGLIDFGSLSLSDLIRWNTGITNLQDNVFMLSVSAVPEPGGWAMVMMSGLMMMFGRRGRGWRRVYSAA